MVAVFWRLGIGRIMSFYGTFPKILRDLKSWHQGTRSSWAKKPGESLTSRRPLQKEKYCSHGWPEESLRKFLLLAYSIDEALNKCGPGRRNIYYWRREYNRQFMPIADRLFYNSCFIKKRRQISISLKLTVEYMGIMEKRSFKNWRRWWYPIIVYDLRKKK